MVTFPVILAWLTLAAVVAVVMGRHGHDVFAWAFLGVVFGPLVIPLALASSRRDAVPPQVGRAGKLDVLVADDGSAGARAAFDAAREALDRTATSWTFAVVVDTEAQFTVRGHDTEAAARQRVARRAFDAQRELRAPVDTAVLYGEPAEALSEYALANGYELIVAGSRGRRASRALLGSVARRLATRSPVPVLVGPAVRRPL